MLFSTALAIEVTPVYTRVARAADKLPNEDQVTKSFQDAYRKLRSNPQDMKGALDAVAPALQTQNEAIAKQKKESDAQLTQDLSEKYRADARHRKTTAKKGAAATTPSPLSGSAPKSGSSGSGDIVRTSATVDATGVATEIDFGTQASTGPDVQPSPKSPK